MNSHLCMFSLPSLFRVPFPSSRETSSEMFESPLSLWGHLALGDVVSKLKNLILFDKSNQNVSQWAANILVPGIVNDDTKNFITLLINLESS